MSAKERILGDLFGRPHVSGQRLCNRTDRWKLLLVEETERWPAVHVEDRRFLAGA
jgi:hypothetical protein